ncbi:MAG: PqqD family protein [Gemmatimonadetes bacterium]|nr:PqqD family protein [Gemmatimonadota bacterium]MBI3568447.1 PqqD family protein [Gemmatimonadota bacterium]
MPTSLSPSSRVVVSRDQVSTNLSGEEVILSVKDGVYFGLDPVGARIWALLQERRTLDDVADAVAAEYEVDRARALADLLALAAELLDAGLIEVVPEPAR